MIKHVLPQAWSLYFALFNKEFLMSAQMYLCSNYISIFQNFGKIQI